VKVTWAADAWDQYLYWQGEDRKIVKRINLLIKDIQRNGRASASPNRSATAITDSGPVGSPRSTGWSTRSRPTLSISRSVATTTRNDLAQATGSGSMMRSPSRSPWIS
jgi:hypothetical protein